MRTALFIALVAPLTTFGQQSFFNVPSTQGTTPGHLFGQVQVGAGSESGEVGTTLELGLLEWLEIGVNVLHTPMYQVGGTPTSGPAYSATTVNANLLFQPAPWLSWQLGAQAGAGFIPGGPPAGAPVSTVMPALNGLEPVLYGWGTVRFEAPGRFGAWVVGAYTGNRGALGKGPPIGGLIGCEIPILEQLLHAQADWMIGLNDVSVAVVGLALFLGKHFQLSAGAQFPSPGSGNPLGGILAFTYTPTADENHRRAEVDQPQTPMTASAERDPHRHAIASVD